MKMPINCISLAISIIYFAISFYPAYAKETGWILTQHSKIFGDQYIYINTHGVKCINPNKASVGLHKHRLGISPSLMKRTKLYYPLSSSKWKTKIAKNDCCQPI